MAFTIRLDTELGILELTGSGEFTLQDAEDSRARALASGVGPHLFLVDLTAAEPALSTLDIYHEPREWGTAGFHRGNKIALVVQREGKVWADATFWETTGRNQGWNVAVFSRRDEAIQWLTRHLRDETQRTLRSSSDT